MIGYQARRLGQRKRCLRLRERFARRGKTFGYVDESGFAPGVPRRYAYALKGKRVYGLISRRRRPRTSLIAARIGKQFEAPFLFEGPCKRGVFNGWLARQLCPLLGEDHIVVMDNVPFHKGKNTADLIHRTGATLLFLPPYSPDLNLIEHDFAVLKKRREYAPMKPWTTLSRRISNYGLSYTYLFFSLKSLTRLYPFKRRSTAFRLNAHNKGWGIFTGLGFVCDMEK